MSRLREQTIAITLFIGAGFLLYRTIAMLAEGASQTLMPWVVALLMVELIIDAIAVIVLLTWAIGGSQEQLLAAIRVTATVVIVHAVRVAIFVLGRTGPWRDFDVQPEARASHAQQWNWGEVYFAGTMSAISVIALFIFWRYWRRKHPGISIAPGCGACSVDPQQRD